ncbi:MAG: ABC transporter ATP-binding protein, partial [Anaerolineales bacterium]|nr:ABC transporter ATP-binding protein [Anaerolineales bacterium]
HLNVGQNVGFGLKIRRVAAPERERRVKEALELVRMGGYENRRTTQLSGGQQQRIALARALVNEPTVLLLDEPLGALDLKLRKEVQLELKQLQSQLGITFIYVTHDQEEALTMSDRIAVMQDGVIQQMGAPREIYESPSNRFVADFIGETNFLNGRLSQTTPTYRLTVAENEIAVKPPETAVSLSQAVTLAIRPE